MANRRDEVKELLFQVIDEVNHQTDRMTGGLAKSEESVIVGEMGGLDSFSIILLIVGVDKLVQERFGVTLALLDGMMEEGAAHPFRTVGSLIDTITAKLE